MNTELKKRRIERGITQVEVAQKSGVTTRSYQRIESGRVTTVDTAILIAEVLGITRFDDFKKLFGSATP